MATPNTNAKSFYSSGAVRQTVSELATNAELSAEAAADSESNAASSASAAATSETNAAASAAAAATSETNAGLSETNAATSETNAASSEASASNSATAAATSETNAAASASAAATSETNAASSATAAGTSETNAAASASAASTSETNAAASASAASTSETNAAASASAASTSETNAAASESAASTSATNAATSETNAAASFDSFDDRYLGAKATDPTLDNDGNALLVGALYWNSETSTFKAYDGSLWVTAPVGASSVSLDSTGLNTSATNLQEAVQATLVGRKNHIINGNFDIWQRGTSFTSASYGADRWVHSFGTGAGTVSRQSFSLGQTDVPGEPIYYLRHARTTASTVGTAVEEQRIEGVRSLAGQAATVSFYAKAGAAKTFNVDFLQNFGTGGTPAADVITNAGDISLTTSWQKFTFTVSVPSISGKTIGTDSNDYLAFRIEEAASFGTFTLDVSQVQIEKGSTSTDFEYRSTGEELAFCQRYYEEGTYRAELPIANDDILFSYQTNCSFVTEKRATPAVSGTNDQGTFTATGASSTGAAIGRSDSVANRVNSGTYKADAEL